MEDGQKPLRLLSLDGGGIRGLSSLYILRNIMATLDGKLQRPPGCLSYPCEHFDLIAGTSTGGLIAVMLGTLQMDIDTCIQKYLALAPVIFPKEGMVSASKLVKTLKAVFGVPRFKPEPLEEAIKQLVEDKFENKDTPFNYNALGGGGGPECKAFLCVTSEKLRNHFKFRSYISSPDDINCTIWQACRATSAAPTIFPPVLIGNPPVAYVDGGLGYNNPTRELMAEASRIWSAQRPIGCIVSVGTGVMSRRDVGQRLKPLMEALVEMATDSEKTAREIQEEMRYTHGASQEVYFRFNVHHGLEKIGLEEWKEMDRVDVATRDYLNEYADQVQRCAAQLLQPDATLRPRATEMPEKFSMNIAMRRVKYFVARPALHTKLRSALDQNRSSNGPQFQKVVIVHGLGGAGKSQLVLNYILEHRSDYAGVFWIDASRKDLVEQQYTRIYQLLYDKPNMDRRDAPEYTILVLNVHQWFRRRSERFVLIFDGADAIDDPAHPDHFDLNLCIPDCKSVDVLITSRFCPARRFTDAAIEVDRMDTSEARELFLETSGLRSDVSDSEQAHEVEKLVNELGCLPLALTLAGSYVANTPDLQSDICQYLPKYRACRTEILSEKPNPLLDQYKESVLTTWEVSFMTISVRSPLAARLLSFFSFLDPDDIFPELLKRLEYSDIPGEPPIDEKGTESDSQGSGAAIPEYKLQEALSTLRSFSLVRWMPDKEAYLMHHLVQAWGYERLGLDQRTASAQSAAHFMKREIPRIASPTTNNRLARHLMANFNTVSQTRVNENPFVVMQIFPWFASFFGDSGFWSNELRVKQYIFDTLQRTLGGEDPNTTSAKNGLAIALLKLGRHNEADAILPEVIEGFRSFNWEGETIAAQNNLATSLAKQARFNEALRIFQQVHAKRADTLGENDAQTISAMSNIANVLHGLGCLSKAEEMNREVVKKRKSILGKYHVETINAMSNLANTLFLREKLDEAEKVARTAVDRYTCSCVEHHPHKLSAMTHLARILERKGEVVEAERICKEVLRIMDANRNLNGSQRGPSIAQ